VFLQAPYGSGSLELIFLFLSQLPYFKSKEQIEMQNTLLFIDNDVIYCEALEPLLTRKGFQVAIAQDALTGLEMTDSLQPDAVILDIMLPDLDGWQTCSCLRAKSDVPIIFLTALRAEENVIKGLNLGADGYIIKPVTAEVLAARIKAVLQRVKRSKVAGSSCEGRPGFDGFS
jgi:DNA-binding response OmpR family regulator